MTKRSAVVIDDEPDLTVYISTILEGHDFTVHTANEARGGEDLILEHHPDIILIDIMMPGRSGVQLFARLRGNESLRDTPIVMVTGIKEKMGVDWGEIVGRLKARKPDGFVEKPIDPARLIAVVEQALSGKIQGSAHG